MQRSNIFLESLCHILPHPNKPESGTFCRQDWCREQEFGFVEVDCVVSCFHDVSGKMSRYEFMGMFANHAVSI